jgi:hypothetical protein
MDTSTLVEDNGSSYRKVEKQSPSEIASRIPQIQGSENLDLVSFKVPELNLICGYDL